MNQIPEEKLKEWREEGRQWWINFPGDPRISPGMGETFRAWEETHIKAYVAAKTSSYEREMKLVEALKKIKNKETCEVLYGSEKYVSYEAGWEGVAEFARQTLNDLGYKSE